MPGDLFGQISKAWAGLRKKTSETVARQEAAFARGKIAGTPVTDDEGNVLVDAGHRIDDTAIERAAAAGKLHALAAAAMTAHVQDFKEKAREQLDRTPDGIEARALNSVDDFIEARRYVGRIAGVDVTDIRGNVLIPAGKEINERDVQIAREAGQLSALIYSAQQPAPEPLPTADHRPPATQHRTPSTQHPTPIARPRLPLVQPSDHETEP